MGSIIDGKKIAETVYEGLSARVQALISRGIRPGLAVVLVGEDPASAIYVRNKERACARLGIESKVLRLGADTPQDQLLDLIDKLNADASVHGILIQLPLPGQIDETAVLNRVSPQKDVDCFHPLNAGKLLRGERGFLPCTPAGVMRLLEEEHIDPSGKEVVVVGRSNIVGKPVAMMLLQKNATVTICHSRTRDLAQVTRRADILVVAVGKAKFVTGEMVKSGAVVIDVGVNRLGGKKIAGDVDFEAVAPVAAAITPVPGGVGAMTIAMLMENAVFAAEEYGAV